MSRTHRLEVADVFRSYQDDFLTAYSPSGAQRRVLRNLSVCRTAALGGHVRECDHCGRREIAYNSCCDRHCPKCQAKKQADWLQARSLDLLEVPYFHVVFTLPEPLGPLALQNQKTLYKFLFRAASETLLTLARDPKYLGAKIGLIAVLHTWGQNLLHHPHLHCVVPGGGPSLDESRWVPSRQDFFLPCGFSVTSSKKSSLLFCKRLTGKNSWSSKAILSTWPLPMAGPIFCNHCSRPPGWFTANPLLAPLSRS